MSWQATAWAVEQTTGSPGAKLMLLTLANYADETGCCWPSQETLARDTEQSLDSVQRYLRKLEKLKLIRKVARPMGSGRWSSRTYFLPITVAKMSKPQSAAQSEEVPEGTESVTNDAATVPQVARCHAAPDPATMPHLVRDHAAPVRHEPSLEPPFEPSLETSSVPTPKPRPSAAERQRAFKEGRKGVEVIQNRIARKIGFDGWEILQHLNEVDLQRITTMEERGQLDASALEFVRLKCRRSFTNTVTLAKTAFAQSSRDNVN
jgi:hypothetical protein